jgi:hypothetical protein
MYKPSTYLEAAYLPTYLPIWDLFPTELVTKMKPNISSVELHPQLSNNGYPVDGALVGCWFTVAPFKCTQSDCFNISQNIISPAKKILKYSEADCFKFQHKPMSFGCCPTKCHILLNYFGSWNSLVAWVRSFLEFATRGTTFVNYLVPCVRSTETELCFEVIYN